MRTLANAIILFFAALFVISTTLLEFAIIKHALDTTSANRPLVVSQKPLYYEFTAKNTTETGDTYTGITRTLIKPAAGYSAEQLNIHGTGIYRVSEVHILTK